MKLFNSLLVMSVLFTLIILNLNCSDEDTFVGTPDNISLSNPEMTYDNSVVLAVDEYVKVTHDAGYYYTWINTATFSCYDGQCFSPPTVLTSSFTTPAASRTVGSDLYETQYFRFVKSSSWVCQSTNWCAYWRVFYLGNNYLNQHTCFYGTNTNCSPSSLKTNSYGATDNNVTLPASTSIAVWYGVDVLVEDP